MESFSQRKGLKPIKNVMQVDSMDDDLRNGLWNVLWAFYLNRRMGKYINRSDLSGLNEFKTLLKQVWNGYFKKPLDTVQHDLSRVRDQIKVYFFERPWYEVYDFLEFVANNYPDEYKNTKFMNHCNSVLEKEVSAYRFVGKKIIQITSETEIAEIEKALDDTPKPINIHLKRAMDLLADRCSPDYRNSIKESISAVEAISKQISGNPKVKLEQALEEMEKKTRLHPALKRAFSNLYGYTSDAEGIRHALMDEPNVDFEDAKFMLVSCSAFVNYLITKVSKAGAKS